MKKIIILGAILCLAVPMYAKDLVGRFGLGSEALMIPYGTGQAFHPLNWNAVSLRTYINPQFGLGGTFAMAADGGTTVGLGANGFYVLAAEPSVNLLAKLGFNMGLDGEDLFAIPLTLNAEFFIDKLANLGIDLGVGLVQLDIGEDETVFYLGTGSLATTLGFHYYF